MIDREFCETSREHGLAQAQESPPCIELLYITAERSTQFKLGCVSIETPVKRRSQKRQKHAGSVAQYACPPSTIVYMGELRMPEVIRYLVVLSA